MVWSEIVALLTGALNDALKERGLEGEITIVPSWDKGPFPSLRKYSLGVFLSLHGVTGELLRANENVVGTNSDVGYMLTARKLIAQLLKDDTIWNSISTRHP